MLVHVRRIHADGDESCVISTEQVESATITYLAGVGDASRLVFKSGERMTVQGRPEQFLVASGPKESHKAIAEAVVSELLSRLPSDVRTMADAARKSPADVLALHALADALEEQQYPQDLADRIRRLQIRDGTMLALTVPEGTSLEGQAVYGEQLRNWCQDVGSMLGIRLAWMVLRAGCTLQVFRITGEAEGSTP